MIDNLSDLAIYVRIVELGSMTEAAQAMSLSLAVVSKRLSALEKRLGVRLLNRTTRMQSLTQEGLAFHAHCVSILSEVHDAENAMARSRDTVDGLLRITAPRSFGRRYVAPIAAQFQRQHASLRVELILDDDIVDLVAGKIDVALRFGVLEDSTMTAHYVAPSYRVLCASPEYLARCGTPADPSQLTEHDCIVYRGGSKHWMFQREGAPYAVEPRSTFLYNDGDAGQALALAGAGIFFKAVWDVGAYLTNGALVQLMPGFAAPAEPLHLVYPHALHLSPRVRQFSRFAIGRLRDEWKW